MPNPESTTATPRAARPRLPRWRRLCAWTVLALLILIVLGLLAFLLRRPLFENLLRGAAERELSSLLRADVTIGAIGGSWIGSLRVDGIEVRGRDGDLLREVRGMSVAARFSAWDLLHGELRGLRTARVHAERIVIDTTGRPPGGAPNASREPAPPVDVRQFAALLPRGAEIDVADLDFGAGSHRRQGRFLLSLEPGTGPRHLQIAHRALRADADLSLHSAETPTIAGSVRAEDLAGLAACFGLQAPGLSDGTAHVVADLALAPLRIRGSCVLEGLRAEHARLQRSEISLLLDQQQLEVPSADVDLDGVRLRATGFVLPSPFGEQPIALAAASGAVDLDIERLEPWRDLLPAEVAALLPVSGRLHGWIEHGLLHVGECRLVAAGASLVVDHGVLPLDDFTGLSRRDLELGFALDLPVERQFAVAGTEARAVGRITGTLAGSLVAPRVAATLDLSRTACEYGVTGRTRAAVTFAGGVLHVRNLDAEGIAIGNATGTSSVHGDVRITLPDGSRPLAIAADVSGQAHPALLAALGKDLAAAAARMQPFRYSVAGEIASPGGAPAGTARVAVSDLVVAALPPASVEADLQVSPASLHIERCRVLAPAALDLRGDLPLAGGALDLELQARDQDLGFWSALLMQEQLRGALSLHARARGTLDEPQVDLDARGELTALGTLAARWPGFLGEPPQAPVQLRLLAHHTGSGLEVEELSLASAGEASTVVSLQARGALGWHFGAATGPGQRAGGEPLTLRVAAHGPGAPDRNLPWKLAAELAVAAHETRFDDLRFEAGPGSLHGAGSLAAGQAQAFTPAAFAAAAVAARLRLDDLRLESLPASLAGLAVAQGTLRGEVTLRGTLARPEPRVELDLADAQVRAPGVPRLTDLSGTIRGDLSHIEASGVRAKMGAGPVTLAATLTSRNGWTEPDLVAVSAHLTGTQALVVNTPQVRMRGDVDLTASGTLGKLLVRGDIAVTSGRFAQRIAAIPSPEALKSRGGAGTGEGVVLSLIDPPFGQRVEFDIRIRTRRNFEVRTHLFDTDLSADLRLRGDAAQASCSGNVAANTGTLRLPGSTMLVRTLLVTFREEDPLHPRLQLLAEGRRHGYDVQLDLHGPITAPEYALTSTPGLPAEDLLVLVSTGSLPERLREQGTAGQAALVGSYLAEELAAWYMGGETTDQPHENFIDRFSVETGREVSDKGLETVVVEFKLNNRFALQGERDVYEDINGGICIRWRFK